jgi:hypothetical protein
MAECEWRPTEADKGSELAPAALEENPCSSACTCIPIVKPADASDTEAGRLI